eukprot:3486115-Amphidinium_carterae.1
MNPDEGDCGNGGPGRSFSRGPQQHDNPDNSGGPGRSFSRGPPHHDTPCKSVNMVAVAEHVTPIRQQAKELGVK